MLEINLTCLSLSTTIVLVKMLLSKVCNKCYTCLSSIFIVLEKVLLSNISNKSVLSLVVYCKCSAEGVIIKRLQ